MTSQPTCKERIAKELENELETLRKLWALYQNDPEASDPDYGRFDEHGLCFDYVAAGTFNDQRQGFFRFQISTGGPGDEFRFYTDAEHECYLVEYWFLDWFDGASLELSGKDEELLLEIWEWFKDGGSVDHAFDKATKG